MKKIVLIISFLIFTNVQSQDFPIDRWLQLVDDKINSQKYEGYFKSLLKDAIYAPGFSDINFNNNQKLLSLKLEIVNDNFLSQGADDFKPKDLQEFFKSVWAVIYKVTIYHNGSSVYINNAIIKQVEFKIIKSNYQFTDDTSIDQSFKLPLQSYLFNVKNTGYQIEYVKDYTK
jgi:hypothetical protein